MTEVVFTWGQSNILPCGCHHARGGTLAPDGSSAEEWSRMAYCPTHRVEVVAG